MPEKAGYPVHTCSVYDFGIACRDLTPTAHEVADHISHVEQHSPDLTVL